jgi:uncharacterized membrane protein YbhN (UPF0104 family)
MNRLATRTAAVAGTARLWDKGGGRPLGLAVSALSLAAVIWWASRQDAPRFPTSGNALALLCTGVALYLCATLLRGWRWHVILRRAGVVHRTADAYALTAVGYMGNTVLPARGGELLRIVLMANRSSAGYSEILGSILAERLIDATVLVGLFAVMTWIGVAGAPAGQAPAALAVGLTVGASLAIGAYLRLRRRGLMERFAQRVRPLVRSTRLMFGWTGAGLAAVTAGVWVLEGVIVYLVGRSLNVDISIVDGVFVITLASFFALIPAGPGYVGTFDAAILFGLGALDVAGGTAIGFALLVRFILFVPITIGGLLLLLFRYGGLGLLRAPKAGPREQDHAENRAALKGGPVEARAAKPTEDSSAESA